MDTPSQTLHSLLLPLNGFLLVLPQPTIAEISARPEVTPVRDSADWLLGVFKWRAEQVPLISFENLCGEARGATTASRHVAVIYALGDAPDLVYYAIELKAIPRPASLTAASLSAVSVQGAGNGAIAATVTVGGHRAVIPALAKIEESIHGQLGSAQISP